MEYNGWSNRDTWLVYLWLTNDQDSYNTVKSVIKDPSYTFAGKVAGLQNLCKIISRDEINYKNVNWDEVIKAFQDE